MKNPFIPILKSKLRNNQNLTDAKAFVGFDGYIDYIQKVVRLTDSKSRSYFEDISQMAEHILAAAGKSAQLELSTQTVKMGGNAPIMSHALGSLGAKNYCAGMLGNPEVNQVFKDMHPNCSHITIGSPAITNALEFDDGKLIFSEVSTFDDLDWEYIVGLDLDEHVLQCMSDSKLIAMVDWSNLPKCTSLWKDVYNIAKKNNWKDKIYFFDLCDPSKKCKSDIREILEIIGLLSEVGKTILGLNENEALKIYQALFTDSKSQSISLTEVASAIYEKLSVNSLLIHPVDRCVLVKKDLLIEVKGHVVQNPKILTGGGDNFNAGFCFGLLNDFTDEECLLAAIATSGAYVQNGFSPNTEQLLSYLDKIEDSR